MNKKITPRVIKMIVIQSIILIVAVTTVGAAVNVHSEYKNTGKMHKLRLPQFRG